VSLCVFQRRFKHIQHTTQRQVGLYKGVKENKKSANSDDNFWKRLPIEKNGNRRGTSPLQQNLKTPILKLAKPKLQSYSET
jgi:hypothetical protein